MNILESFGTNVFGESEMKKRLCEKDYKKIQNVIQGNQQMDNELADNIAQQLKMWAIEKGATHFTHWFQPMTGLTAEKHDAFLSLSKDGTPIIDFGAEQLIKGETDAASFPSGGLRASFEARGYTTWDCTSPPFLRKNRSGSTTLCIPTAYCSFSGGALDEKTPLLKSMVVLNDQALRVLKILGQDAKKVFPTVGAEQEYFLIDKEFYNRRKDLVYTGRTLFGSQPSKGQELEDQYYASMSERVVDFMSDVNKELWTMGVPAKTQHYEAAPSQYELAVMFTVANIAVDHNQIVMDVLGKIADRHGFACILHEKPFAGVSGSGKHNNWSLSTSDGINLLKPMRNSEDNLNFLTFFIAVISAVDNYSQLLNGCCASLSNEARLGQSEAPPNIISIFIGNMFCSLLEDFANGKDSFLTSKERINVGIGALPVLHKDETDRNRTSPFAFTGNKFEFRMPGASQSIGFVNAVLNTIIADELKKMADFAQKKPNKKDALREYLKQSYLDHKKILFNGNSYEKEWHQEAKKRGLPIISNTIEAMNYICDDKTINVFEQLNVLSRVELEARREISLKSYVKRASIEAKTMIKMSRQSIIPACIAFTTNIANAKNQVEASGLSSNTISNILNRLIVYLEEYEKSVDYLEQVKNKALSKVDLFEQAEDFCLSVIGAMEKCRECADKLENIVDKKIWPLPSYGEMLYHIV